VKQIPNEREAILDEVLTVLEKWQEECNEASIRLRHITPETQNHRVVRRRGHRRGSRNRAGQGVEVRRRSPRVGCRAPLPRPCGRASRASAREEARLVGTSPVPLQAARVAVPPRWQAVRDRRPAPEGSRGLLPNGQVRLLRRARRALLLLGLRVGGRPPVTSSVRHVNDLFRFYYQHVYVLTRTTWGATDWFVKFFLGVHHPNWLSNERLAGIPLFISRNSIGLRKTLPIAVTDFALDSGGFTELQRHGEWTISVDDYVAFVETMRAFYGKKMKWVAPQDWMCEPIVINGGKRFIGTKLSVGEHQRRTVKNFIALRKRLGDLVVPVLQGWKVTDYWHCEDMYRKAGVDLTKERTVCVGSVCRRQNTDEAATIMETLAASGLRLHGFGFKKQGIVRCAQKLVSADSMAWSKAGWKRPNENHDHIKRSREPGNFRKRGAADDCANCIDYALDWYADLMSEIKEKKAA